MWLFSGWLTERSELARSKSTTQAPEAKKTGPGGTTTSRSVNGTTKAHGRANSLSNSAATTRTGSRTVNATSSTARQPVRSHSSLAGSRKQPGPSIPRPATSLDTHEEEPAGSVLGKRKGRRQPHGHFSHVTYSLPRRSWTGVHGNSSRNYVRPQTSLPDMRNASLGSGGRLSSPCTAMDQLTLNLPLTGPSSHQPMQDGPKKHSPSKIPTISTPVKLITDRPPSPPKHSSKKNPPIVPYLTKDSTIKAFNNYADAEWNQEIREQKMDEWFNTFLSRFSQAGQESFGLKETVELYKTRSKW